jgi:cytochrome d ubiquinol oxidase subunit II
MVSHIEGYVIVDSPARTAVSNPLNKEVMTETGAWLTNFTRYSWMWLAPLGSLLLPIGSLLSARRRYDAAAFLGASLSNACIILTAGFAMFPFIVPSSVNPNHSLTLWDATSSELTLNIMTGVAFVMVPIIVCYTAFSYRTMFGRLDSAYIERHKHSLY